MNNKYLEVYKQLSNNDKKAFREALAAGDLVTVGAYCRSFAPDNIQSLKGVKGSAGRPDMGLTVEHKKQKNNELKEIRSIKNDVIEFAPGDLVPEGGINEFKEHYQTIINNACQDFYIKHEDLTKKSPFMWVNSLLYEIKKQLPAISVKDAQRVGVAWDCYKELIYKVGLYPMIESFTTLTDIYKEQLYKELTPEHAALRQKIYNDCRDNMVSQVGYNPMTQVNKMFLLKSVYGFKESAAGDLVQDNKKTLNVDDIPIFLPGDISGSDI